MRISLSADLWSGLLFTACGAGFVLFGRQYDYGTAAEMGPGFFPAWLGGFLAVLGVGLLLKAILSTESEEIVGFSPRPALLVFAAFLVFAVLFERAGLIIASVALLGIGSLATTGFRLRSLILFMTGLIAFAIFIFVYLLGVPLQLWPAIGA